MQKAIVLAILFTLVSHSSVAAAEAEAFSRSSKLRDMKFSNAPVVIRASDLIPPGIIPTMARELDAPVVGQIAYFLLTISSTEVKFSFVADDSRSTDRVFSLLPMEPSVLAKNGEKGPFRFALAWSSLGEGGRSTASSICSLVIDERGDLHFVRQTKMVTRALLLFSSTKEDKAEYIFARL